MSITTSPAKAAVLIEALPYIRRFAARSSWSSTAAAAMAAPGAGAALFAQDIVLMHSVGLRLVVVHGGGPQIGDLMRRLGKVPEFVDGLRVTDAETLDIARMVLVGKVNRDIVAAINVHGPLAVGVSGEDAGLITPAPARPELGFVGDVDAVDPGILERLLAEDLVPVVATIGADSVGQAYNINADTAAGALAEALRAEKLVYLTDVVGSARRRRPATLITSHRRRARPAVADGAHHRGDGAEGRRCAARREGRRGPRPRARRAGPHALLLEIFTQDGVGTMVTP